MGRSGVTFKGNQIYAILGMEPIAPEHADMRVSCSFCGTRVERCELTKGTNRAPSNVDLNMVYDDFGKVIGFTEEFKFNARQVNACPKCAHLVQTVAFPSFD